MITVETKVVVTQDHKLTVEVPAEVQPGWHHIVVLIDDRSGSQPKEPPLNFPSYPTGLADPRVTLRREEIYGPDGR